jgi:hypothetical protein
LFHCQQQQPALQNHHEANKIKNLVLAASARRAIWVIRHEGLNLFLTTPYANAAIPNFSCVA